MGGPRVAHAGPSRRRQGQPAHRRARADAAGPAGQIAHPHARTRAAETQATPISITHYTDRDGNFLADVAPRRYFCDTCHVVQIDVKPDVAVQNTFEDVETLVKRTQTKNKPAPKKK